MKRLLAVGTIVAYLGVLLAGLGSHALNYRTSAHPTMYFIVWDMFCGWSAYEDRTHIIGQGESGRYYDLASAPWGDYRPFGDVARHHYDPFAAHSGVLAQSTLRHTEHEPIQQIFIVQEMWAKKFNLPDKLWNERYPEPKNPHSYFHVRKILGPGGQVQADNLAWFGQSLPFRQSAASSGFDSWASLPGNAVADAGFGYRLQAVMPDGSKPLYRTVLSRIDH
jgi:hypothetical protein